MTAPRPVLAVIQTIVLFAAPLAAEAQPAQRAYRIGVLHEEFAPNHPAVEGLKAGLKTLGLEEGRDVRFDIRFTSGNLEALPATAEALVTAGSISSSRAPRLRPERPRPRPRRYLSCSPWSATPWPRALSGRWRIPEGT